VAADALFGDGGVVELDETVGVKLGWWREVAGSLRIGGWWLDARTAPLRADVPDGYGDRGFQATGVYFPTGGCWEVTGRVGSTSLTFHAGWSSRPRAGRRRPDRAAEYGRALARPVRHAGRP
jgi:hypothetical protein